MEVDLPQLAQRVRLDEMSLVVHVESVVHGVALEVGDEPGDINDCHVWGHYRSHVPLFDVSSDNLDILGFLHDVADAAADTVDELGPWSLTGEREGQYSGDVAVDEVVVDMLEAAGFDVLSEESGAGRWDRSSGRLLCVVDPVDGSTNASKGFPWFATSLCVVDDGGPRVALVAEQSGSEIRYSAMRGAGARCDGVPMKAATSVAPSRAVIGVNGVPPADHGWWQVRSMGAAALDLSLVGAGALDGYVDFHSHGVWDYLAAYLICRESGAAFADVHGRNLVVLDPSERRSPVAAATPELVAHLTAVARRALT